MSQDLLGQIVAASGLSAIFAERSISRAIRRAGFAPEALSRADLKQCLPELEKMLATFMDPGDVAMRIATIKKLGG